MVSYDPNYEESGCCPRCGEDPCVCDIEEHPNSYYSDPPGEHEFHDDFDYSDPSVIDYSDREDIFPDPDDGYWPDLDVDLGIESIEHPECFPLVTKKNAISSNLETA